MADTPKSLSVEQQKELLAAFSEADLERRLKESGLLPAQAPSNQPVVEPEMQATGDRAGGDVMPQAEDAPSGEGESDSDSDDPPQDAAQPSGDMQFSVQGPGQRWLNQEHDDTNAAPEPAPLPEAPDADSQDQEAQDAAQPPLSLEPPIESDRDKRRRADKEQQPTRTFTTESGYEVRQFDGPPPGLPGSSGASGLPGGGSSGDGGSNDLASTLREILAELKDFHNDMNARLT